MEKALRNLLWATEDWHLLGAASRKAFQDQARAALEKGGKTMDHDHDQKLMIPKLAREPETDPKCVELAQYILESDEQLISISGSRYQKMLADEIQNFIENWIETTLDNYEPPDPPGWEGGFAENH